MCIPYGYGCGVVDIYVGCKDLWCTSARFVSCVCLRHVCMCGHVRRTGVYVHRDCALSSSDVCHGTLSVFTHMGGLPTESTLLLSVCVHPETYGRRTDGHVTVRVPYDLTRVSTYSQRVYSSAGVRVSTSWRRLRRTCVGGGVEGPPFHRDTHDPSRTGNSLKATPVSL